MDISHIRKEYQERSLTKQDLDLNPFTECQKWVEHALSEKLEEPNAMVVGTATKEGKPSTRTVLLKKLTEKGLEFFTHRMSRKAQELYENPYISATLLWIPLERQVIIEGSVEEVEREEAEYYFKQRGRESQLSSWASKQDHPLQSRKELEEAFESIASRFSEKDVDTPPEWTGFRILPTRFEFWQGGKSRLHDRFQYTFKSGQWVLERLSP